MVSFATAGPGFDVVVLGARGGIEDGNLSAFMIAPAGDGRAVTCDAGSLVNGLRAADEKGVFDSVDVPADSPFTRVGYVLTEQIKGYLISHAHLDHVAGLVIASPDDAKKPIYGLPSVLERYPGQLFQLGSLAEFRLWRQGAAAEEIRTDRAGAGRAARSLGNRDAGDGLSALPWRRRIDGLPDRERRRRAALLRRHRSGRGREIDRTSQTSGRRSPTREAEAAQGDHHRGFLRQCAARQIAVRPPDAGLAAEVARRVWRRLPAQARSRICLWSSATSNIR